VPIKLLFRERERIGLDELKHRKRRAGTAVKEESPRRPPRGMDKRQRGTKQSKKRSRR
jgi:hypothetical protein